MRNKENNTMSHESQENKKATSAYSEYFGKIARLKDDPDGYNDAVEI